MAPGRPLLQLAWPIHQHTLSTGLGWHCQLLQDGCWNNAILKQKRKRKSYSKANSDITLTKLPLLIQSTTFLTKRGKGKKKKPWASQSPNPENGGGVSSSSPTRLGSEGSKQLHWGQQAVAALLAAGKWDWWVPPSIFYSALFMSRVPLFHKAVFARKHMKEGMMKMTINTSPRTPFLKPLS